MKHFVKKIYIILLVLTIFFINFKALAKEAKIQYTSENISNYFLGVISANKHHNNEAFQHLKKVKSLKNVHPKFNIEFIRILVLLEKFDEAFSFSESVWSEDELLFEADLLLGINSFIQEDYKRAEKYFNRLNKISLTNLFHKDFIGNVMLAWNSTSQNNKEMTFKILD